MEDVLVPDKTIDDLIKLPDVFEWIDDIVIKVGKKPAFDSINKLALDGAFSLLYGTKDWWSIVVAQVNSLSPDPEKELN